MDQRAHRPAAETQPRPGCLAKPVLFVHATQLQLAEDIEDWVTSGEPPVLIDKFQRHAHTIDKLRRGSGKSSGDVRYYILKVYLRT